MPVYMDKRARGHPAPRHEAGKDRMSSDSTDSARLLRSRWDELEHFESDQNRGIPAPPPQPEPPAGAKVIDLPGVDFDRAGPPLGRLLSGRRSRRSFSAEGLSQDELSFLLWSAQGVRRTLADGASRRTAPSGGARHPLDTYAVISRVEGMEPGLYAYLPDGHRLWAKKEHPGMDRLLAACNGQVFAASAPLLLIWAAVPARTRWRYGPAAPKLILLDAGHACENLYLACEFLGLGTCAIGAYLQELSDELLGLDGVSSTVVYMAPVGRPGR